MEGLSALQSSLRFIPHAVSGALVNIATAYLISRVKVRTLAVVSALITMVAAPLMATVDVGENYWFAPFWAMILSPVNPDGTFLSIFYYERPTCIRIWGVCGVGVRMREHELTVGWNLVLFTVSNLVISREFPPEMQSLAGGVFNEVSQFGNSVGLAITASIAASVTERSGIEDDTAALMKGYRAAFWTIFASCTTVTLVVWFGMKKGGIVGKKDD